MSCTLQTVETREAAGGTEPLAEGGFPSEKQFLQVVENETSPSATPRKTSRPRFLRAPPLARRLPQKHPPNPPKTAVEGVMDNLTG